MVVEKVAGFVTRDRVLDRTRIRQLLVFRHDNPRAGVQVPAGTVEFNESPSDAVLREVAEETGLSGLTIVGGAVHAPLELKDHEWYLVPHAGGRDTMRRLDLADPIVTIEQERAAGVLLGGRRSDGEPLEWWADRSSVTRDVRRWLFHLGVADGAPDRWERAFDTPHPWSFYWVPVRSNPPLSETQSGWLDLMRPSLLHD